MKTTMRFEDWVREIENNYPPINYEHVKFVARLDKVTPKKVLKHMLKDDFNLTEYMANKLTDYFAYYNL